MAGWYMLATSGIPAQTTTKNPTGQFEQAKILAGFQGDVMVRLLRE